jgi:hypothetical protein
MKRGLLLESFGGIILSEVTLAPIYVTNVYNETQMKIL